MDYFSCSPLYPSFFFLKALLSMNEDQKEDQKLFFKTDYRLMQVKSIAECSKREHSAILSTYIKLPFVFKTSVMSISEWPLKTGLTVCKKIKY